MGADLASVQLRVEGCKVIKDVDQSACPRPIEWAKQVCRQRRNKIVKMFEEATRRRGEAAVFPF